MAAVESGGALLSEVVEFGQKHGLRPSAQEELQSLMTASITLTQKKVTVVVPATVANLGPGLETCGIAVDIWDEFTADYHDSASLEAFGEYGPDVPRGADNLALQGAKFAYEVAGRPWPNIRLQCTHRVPYKQGLGGPSGSFVGGYLVASVLCSEEVAALHCSGKSATDEAAETRTAFLEVLGGSDDSQPDSKCSRGSGLRRLMEKCVSLGWNPGNVCPAIFGALQIGMDTASGFSSHRVPVPNGLVCALWVPDSQEEGSRLPKSDVDRNAAIFNVGRMALLTNCFCTGNFEMFSKATEDTLAQPHCQSQFAFINPICQAAVDVGASGAFPCGYGPSCMALITGRTGDIVAQSSFNELEGDVAKAMLNKADELGVPGRVLVAKPADVGAHVLSQKSVLAGSRGNERIVYFQ